MAAESAALHIGRSPVALTRRVGAPFICFAPHKSRGRAGLVNSADFVAFSGGHKSGATMVALEQRPPESSWWSADNKCAGICARRAQLRASNRPTGEEASGRPTRGECASIRLALD